MPVAQPPSGRSGLQAPHHAGGDQHEAGAHREHDAQRRRHALLGGLQRALLDGLDVPLCGREPVRQHEQPGEHQQQARGRAAPAARPRRSAATRPPMPRRPRVWPDRAVGAPCCCSYREVTPVGSRRSPGRGAGPPIGRRGGRVPAGRVRPWMHALRRTRRRPGREHPAGAVGPGRRRHRRAGAGQGRVLQPRRQRQGPHRAAHGRGRGGVGRAAARRHDRRADVRQHRRRAGDRRPAQGLPLRVRLPGQGRARTSATCSRPTAPRSSCARRPSTRTTRTPTTAPRTGSSGRSTARGSPTSTRTRENPRVALPRHRAGGVGADRRADHALRRRASAPAARSAASAATSRRCPPGGCR